MPSTGGYLVSPRLIASIAASLMLSGVSKSGSPTESEITSRPLALRSRAFCVIAMVADGLTRERTSARKATDWRLSFAGILSGAAIVGRAACGNPGGLGSNPIGGGRFAQIPVVRRPRPDPSRPLPEPARQPTQF